MSRPDPSSAYRFAGNQSDPVARFMFLYNILLQLNNDHQGQVDAFIRRKAPDVSQSLSPKGKIDIAKGASMPRTKTVSG
jgi:hypothetical protein